MQNIEIWFWQSLVSPHMAALANALAEMGYRVVYLAEEEMSLERRLQGWVAPTLKKVELRFIGDSLEVENFIDSAPIRSIHICQGIRANGLISVAQKRLARRKLEQWVIMETVDDSGLIRFFRRFEYRRIFWKNRNSIKGVLAIGAMTSNWLAKRGIKKSRIFPFSYFLQQIAMPAEGEAISSLQPKKKFRFIFVGQLVKRKRVDWLIESLNDLEGLDFELFVIGSGPEEEALKIKSSKLLKEKVLWLGNMGSEKIFQILSDSDCLVLPSSHDGWGAVVTESLMAGTPAICSSKCGSSIAVSYCNEGAIFDANDRGDLTEKLRMQIKKGKVKADMRRDLKEWSKCLNSEEGAHYLLKIFKLERSKFAPESTNENHGFLKKRTYRGLS